MRQHLGYIYYPWCCLFSLCESFFLNSTLNIKFYVSIVNFSYFCYNTCRWHVNSPLLFGFCRLYYTTELTCFSIYWHIFHIKNNSADSNINPLSLTTLKAFLLPSTLYIIEPKFLDNQTKATQVSQYELMLHKNSNWRIVG